MKYNYKNCLRHDVSLIFLASHLKDFNFKHAKNDKSKFAFSAVKLNILQVAIFILI